MENKKVSLAIPQIYTLLDKIGLLTFSTIYQGEVHSRIAHFNGYDEEGFYFRTMPNKPYGRQLLETQKVTVCGHFGEGILNHSEMGEIPLFAPGFTFRMIGNVRFVSAEEIIDKAKTNKMLEVAARDITLYPAMANGNFILYRAKGEVYDYDFEKINRSHKLLRTRFAFGGATYNPAGVHINDKCIACGTCLENCSFDAIEMVDSTYRVIGERCDDCGTCLNVCPVDAIDLSLTL